jgi:glycosyltransferase involved in cell wall biosynthesis
MQPPPLINHGYIGCPLLPLLKDFTNSMKVLVYYPIFRDVDTHTSVNKKFSEIIDAFNYLNIELDIIHFATTGIYFNDTCLFSFSSNKYIRRWQHLSKFDVINKTLIHQSYDFVWIRAGLITPWFWSFTKQCKSVAKKVIYEYGTFPFIKEINSRFDKSWSITNFIYSKSLHNYVDFIITYCGQDEIYNIPCIKMGNGIDKNIIQPTTPLKEKNVLHLIMVSSVFYWHGIDRMIEGLANYYLQQNPKKEIQLMIIGRGSESNTLQSLVKEKALDSYVTFYGEKYGESLKKLYDKAHVGVGALAVHRKNIVEESTLKAREYAAVGLPIILAAHDRDFETVSQFIFKVPLDDSPIELNKLVDFFESLQANNPNYSSELKNFTQKHLTWEAKIQKVIQLLFPTKTNP